MDSGRLPPPKRVTLAEPQSDFEDLWTEDDEDDEESLADTGEEVEDAAFDPVDEEPIFPNYSEGTPACSA